MQKFTFTIALLLGGAGAAFSQNFKMQYSFQALGDALFFRYDPRVNVPMSSYVTSIQDWTRLVSDEDIDIEEIYSRLDPKFAMLNGRLAANVHLSSKHMKATFGISTGRYEFRNFSIHGEAVFRYCFEEAAPALSLEAGFMMIRDNSFGPEAAIRSARNTPQEIKAKMRRFMTEDLFERPVSKGLKLGAYYNIVSCLDLEFSGFIDFVKRSDGARNDYASIGIRARLEP